MPAECWSPSLFFSYLRCTLATLCKRAEQLIMCFSSSVAFQMSPNLHQHRGELPQADGHRLLMLLGTAGSDSPGASYVSQGSRGGVQLPHAPGLLHRPATCIYILCTRVQLCVYVCVQTSELVFTLLNFDLGLKETSETGWGLPIGTGCAKRDAHADRRLLG